MNTSAIGIFDSGIGGLTLALSLKNLLPKERIVYFGDTLHLPYGDKSQSEIKMYSREIVRFLCTQNVKIIVIACHTASALAHKTLLHEFENSVPIYGMIFPTITCVIAKTSIQRLGIIGTPNTISTGIYTSRINAQKPKITICPLSTPLIAPMIEKELATQTINTFLLNQYLSDPVLQDIDSLLLACTHYPFVIPAMNEYYKSQNRGVDIIDPSDLVAESVKDYLTAHRLLSSELTDKDRFFISKYTPSFLEIMKTLFPENSFILSEKRFDNSSRAERKPL